MNDASTLIRPVSRATLPQEIVKSLTDLIMKRVWKPGDLIPSEKELAIRFQVGRSTIREAVKSLVVLGVLEARAGEGSFVREPTSELLSGAFRWGLLLSEGNLDDFVDVRVLVEVECARRAAANRTDELVAQLECTARRRCGRADGPRRLHGQRHPLPPRDRPCGAETRSSRTSGRRSSRSSGSGIPRPITSRKPRAGPSPNIVPSRMPSLWATAARRGSGDARPSRSRGSAAAHAPAVRAPPRRVVGRDGRHDRLGRTASLLRRSPSGSTRILGQRTSERHLGWSAECIMGLMDPHNTCAQA